MIRMSVKIPRRLLKLKKNGDKGLVNGLKKAGIILESEAKRTRGFTDRTGNLRGSISSDRVNKQEHYVDVNANAEYAAHLEYGTQHIAPVRFMSKAAKSKQREIVDAINDEIYKELKK
jgi:HK97 gp10 family phage protein